MYIMLGILLLDRMNLDLFSLSITCMAYYYNVELWHRCEMQRQTTVTAYYTSKQLLLSAIAR